ncbi:MAG TPA: O-methyltransferase [Acidobacteriota bacterium]|nr:O-methyltransferase [Acidobacteriota bacterium]
MESIIDQQVEKYMYGLLPARDSVLAEMEEKARQRSIPIIGPAVARVLCQYAMIAATRRVFEMGSAIGYSTIWLARAAGPSGKVYYTDGSRQNAEEARSYFQRAGVADRIEVLVGDAIELLDKVHGEFDLIFNDVDKHQYPQVFGKAVPRIRKGGLFITDNVLWSGRVARGEKDKNTQGVREFNRLIFSTDQLYPAILPIRDGIAVCVKQ